MNTVVLKFGGAAVATPAHFSHVADLIIAKKKTFSKVVVVISAMGGTTDQLIELASQVHPNPPQREKDMLISVGERISMSLLAMALCLKNQEAVSLTGSQSGIITCKNHGKAQIIDVRPQRIEKFLEEGKIVIVAGFQGVSQENKEITTLGRGGSDTTAVALALALSASDLYFFKDVPGVFDCDPKYWPQSQRYDQLNYQAALSIVKQGAKILHARAIELAAKNGLPLQVKSFIDAECPGTLIFDSNQKRRTIPIYEQIENY